VKVKDHVLANLDSLIEPPLLDLIGDNSEGLGLITEGQTVEGEKDQGFVGLAGLDLGDEGLGEDVEDLRLVISEQFIALEERMKKRIVY
jgi:hypothetical protein